jgi:ATP/maltotriose-dependent transcriptional regulator MalT
MKPLLDLSRLYCHTGNMEAAWKYAQAATAAARKTELYPVMVMALENQASMALEMNEPAAALAAAAEAVEVIEPGKMSENMRGRALAYHAECLVRTGDVTAAEERLQEGWKMLAPGSTSKMLPGPVLALAKWWEVKACIETAKGAIESAAESISCAIEFRRMGLQRAVQPIPYGTAAMARTLETMASVSSDLGNEARAQQAREEAKEFRKLSHLPPLPTKTPDR